MFDTKIKTQKLNLFSTNEFYSKKSLNNLGAENQIIKSTHAIVSSLGKDNNVIFTTSDGDSLEFKAEGEFKLGDEVSLNIDAAGGL